MSNEGNLNIHSTLDIGIQENLKVELCMWKYTMTSTGKEVKLAEVTAWPACEPELESSNMSAVSAAGWPAAAASADVSLTLKVGMGSRACSRNSNMLGVIMVSSGILCKVIQADNWALLAPYFLPVIVKIGAYKWKYILVIVLKMSCLYCKCKDRYWISATNPVLLSFYVKPSKSLISINWSITFKANLCCLSESKLLIRNNAGSLIIK